MIKISSTSIKSQCPNHQIQTVVAQIMAPEYLEASIVEDSLQISLQEKQTLLSAVRIS